MKSPGTTRPLVEDVQHDMVLVLAKVTRKSITETRPAKHRHRDAASTTTPSKRSNLLALLGLGSSLVLGALLADTNELGVGASLAESAESTALDVGGELGLVDLLEAGDDGGLDAESRGDALDGLAGLLVLGGIGLLGLVGLAGEDDEAGLVGLQALDIGGKGLLGEVGAAGVNRDTDGGSKELGDTSSL